MAQFGTAGQATRNSQFYRLIYVNSHDKLDKSMHGADFETSFNNTEYSGNLATSICTREMTFPNLFGNVYRGADSLSVNGTPISIPHGQYNLTDLISTVESAVFLATGISLTISEDPVTHVLTWTFGASVTLDTNGSDFVRTLGFEPRKLPVTGTVFTSCGPPYLNRPHNVKCYMNFGGGSETPTLESRDSNNSALVETVSLANAEYGQYVTKRRDHREMGSVSFLRDRRVSGFKLVMRDSYNVPLVLPCNVNTELTFQVGFLSRYG